MSNITVDGVEYAPINKSDDIRICVLQRGWVKVGDNLTASMISCNLVQL